MYPEAKKSLLIPCSFQNREFMFKQLKTKLELG
jgi:hypothetical protein